LHYLKQVQALDSLLWGLPFMIFIIAIGGYFFVRSKGFTIAHLPYILKRTLGRSIRKKGQDEGDGRHISSFEAACIAIGGTVGNGNIAGVATAIATGGPGAVFWIWVWAFFGMIVKCVETSLSCYYRSRNDKGEFYGGTTYFLEKGLVKKRGHRSGWILAVLFGVGFILQFLGGSQAYSIAESLNTCFGMNMIVFTLIYSALLFYIIYRGVPRIAKFASRAVPFMCVAYLLGGVGIIALNIGRVPAVFAMIFKSAFTPTAASGGFVGASVAVTVRTGLARSINSNEAGQGSSPLIHGSADTPHPVAQGLWGSAEVFVDTMIICIVTALSVLCSGVWNSGTMGASLAIAAFRQSYGQIGVVFIGVMMFFFGLTTTSGWFSYYLSIIQHFMRRWPKARDRVISVFRFLFPLPNIVIVSSIVLTGNGPDLFWAIVDITLAIPVFANLLSIFLLRRDFWTLLKDFKARYMGIGQIEAGFVPFYDTPPMPGDQAYPEYHSHLKIRKPIEKKHRETTPLYCQREIFDKA
jgi:AGCS family alanine or glycine:cation symporter